MRNMSVVLLVLAMFVMLSTEQVMPQEQQEMSPEAKAEMEAWQKAATPNTMSLYL